MIWHDAELKYANKLVASQPKPAFILTPTQVRVFVRTRVCMYSNGSHSVWYKFCTSSILLVQVVSAQVLFLSNPYDYAYSWTLWLLSGVLLVQCWHSFCEIHASVLLFTEISPMHVSDLQLEMTSMYCQVVSLDVTPSDQLSSRLHHWNTLLFVGLFTAKVTATICLPF